MKKKALGMKKNPFRNCCNMKKTWFEFTSCVLIGLFLGKACEDYVNFTVANMYLHY